MVEIRDHCIYSFYTPCNKIYIGLTKNFQLREWQHNYKSCNYRLRKLLRDGKTVVKSAILHDNLTHEEAVELERKLIKQYRNDPNYEILNVQSGGMRPDNKIVKTRKISSHLSDDDICKMRTKYSRFKSKINARLEAAKYNIGYKYFMTILKGQTRCRAPGPILGRNYFNG